MAFFLSFVAVFGVVFMTSVSSYAQNTTTGTDENPRATSPRTYGGVLSPRSTSEKPEQKQEPENFTETVRGTGVQIMSTLGDEDDLHDFLESVPQTLNLIPSSLSPRNKTSECKTLINRAYELRYDSKFIAPVNGVYSDETLFQQEGIEFEVAVQSAQYNNGLKPKDLSPQQDNFVAAQLKGGALVFGIFDGHGAEGDYVSHFAATQTPFILEEHLRGFTQTQLKEKKYVSKMLKGVVSHLDSALSSEMTKKNKMFGGSTLTLGVVIAGQLYFASLGDSPAWIDEGPKKGFKRANQLLRLTDPKELALAEAMSPRIKEHLTEKGRIDGLNMASALGDFKKSQVIKEPIITGPFSLENCRTLILASDGVLINSKAPLSPRKNLWDDSSPFNSIIEKNPTAAQVSEQIVKKAHHEGTKDNTTVMTVLLKKTKSE